jgi:hypothetical protein
MVASVTRLVSTPLLAQAPLVVDQTGVGAVNGRRARHTWRDSPISSNISMAPFV